MAWIESHQSLLRHKKTVRASAALRVDRHKLIGHLHALWWWALDNVPSSGRLGDLTDDEIAMGAEWPKDASSFVASLTQAGFIDIRPDGRYLHDWHDYAGRLQDRRVDDRERKRVAADEKRKAKELRQNSDGIPSEPPRNSSGFPHVPNPTQPNPTNHPEGGTGETAERPSPPADPPAPPLLVDKPSEPDAEPVDGASEREAEIVRALVGIPTYDATATETLALIREMAALWPSVDQRREVPSFREWWLAKDARHPPKRHRWKSRWANWIKRTGGAGSRASLDAPEPVGRGDAITVEERQRQIELARAGVEF